MHGYAKITWLHPNHQKCNSVKTDLLYFKTKLGSANTETLIFIDVVYPVDLQKLFTDTHTHKQKGGSPK